MKLFLHHFGLSSGLTLLCLAGTLSFLGSAATATVLVLAIIELAFSFDNAIINAKILAGLSAFWRTLFLSVGILIAVFGMRLVVPLAVVGLSAHVSAGSIIDLALHHPAVYSQKLIEAYPAITAFGGAFLLMLSLHFFIADRSVQWIGIIERPLSLFVRWWLPAVIVFVIVASLSRLPFNHHSHITFWAGIAGLSAYAALNGLIALIGNILTRGPSTEQLGWAAFVVFMYLELLDASLSFDGVIGAFAITNKIWLIAIGLGIGALWVRSLTAYMVHRKTIELYKYLEHGAHYAITVLAVTMLLSMVIKVPDFPVGLVCLALILASFIASRRALQRD